LNEDPSGEPLSDRPGPIEYGLPGKSSRNEDNQTLIPDQPVAARNELLDDALSSLHFRVHFQPFGAKWLNSMLKVPLPCVIDLRPVVNPNIFTIGTSLWMISLVG